MKRIELVIEKVVFFSRWLQAPIYLGLIIGSVLFSIKFFEELVHLFADFGGLSHSKMMLALLGLVDASMVINLMIVVIIGGYWTFVSKIDLEDHEDKPDWLVKINANTLKIKLVVSLVSISGVHLLETFIASRDLEIQDIVVQISIHMVFVVSALLLAVTDRIMSKTEH